MCKICVDKGLITQEQLDGSEPMPSDADMERTMAESGEDPNDILDAVYSERQAAAVPTIIQYVSSLREAYPGRNAREVQPNIAASLMYAMDHKTMAELLSDIGLALASKPSGIRVGEPVAPEELTAAVSGLLTRLTERRLDETSEPAKAPGLYL